MMKFITQSVACVLAASALAACRVVLDDGVVVHHRAEVVEAAPAIVVEPEPIVIETGLDFVVLWEHDSRVRCEHEVFVSRYPHWGERYWVERDRHVCRGEQLEVRKREYAEYERGHGRGRER